jgi:hypothetical protein
MERLTDRAEPESCILSTTMAPPENPRASSALILV